METTPAGSPALDTAIGVGAVVLGVAAVIALVLLIVVLRKGGRMAGDHVFRASRWSSGNRLFPTQVAITPDSIDHYTPEWFGRKEHSIHMAHVASVHIDTNLLFSDVIIESSGGTSTVVCHGHRKRDAARMKDLIEQYQTAYYRTRHE
jgi:hypothetical protein